jgi:surface carbohydrate biosynthesis protein
MGKFREAGYAIAAADEESLPFAGDGFLVNIDPTAMRHTDLFLALNDAQRAVLCAEYPGVPITVVGSARIDLLRRQRPPRPMAEPYILFNTNFALTNSLRGDAQTVIDSLIAGGGLNPSTETGRVEIQTRYDFEVKTRQEMMALIRWCAANLPMITVVRPHPTERAEMWSSMVGKNLRTVAGSAPIPWIAHAHIVVHANSTTGLEAAVLGVPCLNISPPKYDH